MIKATAIYIIALCLFAPLHDGAVAQQLDCSLARPNPERLTASSGASLGDVTIVGMNDNGPITGLSITITGVRQDEDPDEDFSPSSFFAQLFSFIFNILFGWLFFPGGFPGNADDNSQGGRLLADAVVDGSLTSLARQRDPDGNGRVYTLYFLAKDISNNSCQGTVTVCVPNGNSCVNDGPSFDSLSN